MSFKLKDLKDGMRGVGRNLWRGHSRSIKAPVVALSEPIEQGNWANLPPELLLDIIRRVEESETVWPARAVVVSCACVCRSWRDVTKEIVKSPEECGRLTFPISLKQPGPRAVPVRCFLKRDRATSTFRMSYGLLPYKNYKLLLAARKLVRAARTDFIISLAADDFSKNSNAYVGKLRSNFMGTKFTIHHAGVQYRSDYSGRFNAKQVSRKPQTISNGRGLRYRMFSIPVSSSTLFPHCTDEKSPALTEKATYFKGRVAVVYDKKLKLVATIDTSLNTPAVPEKVILQLWDIGSDIFTLEFCYPLSAFQAFAICLSSIFEFLSI